MNQNARIRKGSLISALFVSLSFLPVAQAQDTAEPIKGNTTTEILLNLKINEQDTRQTVIFLQDDKGRLYIQKSDLERNRVNLPDMEPVIYGGVAYYPIDAFSSQEAQVDKRNLVVNLNIAAQSFQSHTYVADLKEIVVPTEPDLGGFLNYDVYAQQYSNLTTVNTLLAPGLFYGKASATSGFLLEYGNNDNNVNDNSTTRFIRLNSTIEIDYPENMTSLYLGDSFSTPGMWGNSVDFGGIQWGTNFGTQPAFITFPLPTVQGEATVPSVVDLYLNNGLLNRQSVPPGPFTINEIPIVNGSGTIDVVTTDLLGRQTTITLPYYGATSLLKPGLHDYSLEAGFIRQNFGSESDDYGQFMAVATDRVGLTDILTAEWRLEGLLDQQTAGAGAQYLLAQWATITAAAAVSRNSDLGNGGLLELGLSRQDQNGFSFGFNMTGTSSEFTQIGFGEDTVAPAFQAQYFAGTSVFDVGTLAATYIQQNNRDSNNQGFITLSYNQPLFKVWAMNISTLTHIEGPTNNAIYLTFSRMFDTYTSFNVGGGAQTDVEAQGRAQLNRALPLGTGWGYNLYAAPGGNQTYQASLSAQNDVGTYSVGAAYNYGEVGYQADVRGALAVIDNDFYLSRSLGTSFGVVEVPGLENVQIYNYNQVVGITNKDGKAFMPNLLAYQNNKVAIEPDDLPIGTEIQTAEVNVIPYFQSGLLVRFPIESYFSAILHVVDAKGKELPSGTLIQAQGQDQMLMVAAKGETYLNRLSKGLNHFTAQYNGKVCHFSIDYTNTSADQIPDLGTVVCKEKR